MEYQKAAADGVISPLGLQAPYLGARQLAEERGKKLPPNPLLDDYLVGSERWKGIPDAFPLWADELLAYPAVGRAFRRGLDIVDDGTGWSLPWSEAIKHVAADLLAAPGAGLFIIPGAFDLSGTAPAVIPQSIILLPSIVPFSGGCGLPEKKTRMPLPFPPATNPAAIPEDGIRFLLRIRGAGVRPIMRVADMPSITGRRGIYADINPDAPMGVAVADFLKAVA
ncbi:MAG: hypothetical protein AB1529_01545 [Candidatus Micrarchaeota archaeon]